MLAELPDPFGDPGAAAARRGSPACSTGANGARWIALVTTLGDARARHRPVGAPTRSAGAQWQFTEYHAALRPLRLGARHRRHRPDADRAHRLPDADLHRRLAGRRSRSACPNIMACFLLMETLMIGVFAAQDLFLFYIFFEAGLIPMYLIIGIWGGADRIYAAYKFFLYTLLGSVLMLIAMLWMVERRRHHLDPGADGDRFPGRGADLAVARLLRQLRGQDADVAGPHLASRRARPGADRGLGDPRRRAAEDGRLRLRPLLAADVPRSLGPARSGSIFGLSMVAVVYTSLVALVQQDMKKLIAYSSVAHMAFVTIGLFAFNRQGIEGGADRHAQPRPRLGRALPVRRRGLRPAAHAARSTAMAAFRTTCRAMRLLFMVFTMASVGLPGTSGFVGEFLALVGAYAGQHLGRARSPPPASSSAPPTCSGSTGGSPSAAARTPRRRRCPISACANCAMLAPIAAAVLWMGVYPESFMAPMRADVGRLLDRIERAAPPGDAAARPRASPRRAAGACAAEGAPLMIHDLLLILPEEILSVGAIAADAGRRLGRRPRGAAADLARRAVARRRRRLRSPASATPAAPLFGGLFVADSFAAFAKIVIYAGAAVAMLAAMSWFGRDTDYRAEYPVLILFSAVGMGMMVSATDLLTLYVGLELQSLAAYVLATFQRTDDALGRGRPQIFRARRARLRHPALRHLPALRLHRHDPVRRHRRGARRDGVSTGELFGIVFVLAGLAFKISAVPFHMWTPDVYEGAPTPVTAFFASAPKVAAMALLVRVCGRGDGPGDRRLAADRDLRRAGLDHARRRRRDRPDATSSGCSPIQLDQQCRLRAGRPRRRRASAGVAVGAVLHGGLCRDDARRLPRRAADARRGRPAGRDDRLASPACRDPARARAAPWRSSCSASPASRRCSASGPSSWCSTRRSRRTSPGSPRSRIATSVIGAFYYIMIVKLMYFDEPAPAFAETQRAGRRGADPRSPRCSSRRSAISLIGPLEPLTGQRREVALF